MSIDYLETIKYLKNTLKCTNEALAIRLGISVPTFYRYLNKDNNISKSTKDRIRFLCKENDLTPIEYVPDYEFIKKICSLDFDLDYLNKDRDIKYDLDNPFRKYYDINIIINAHKKLESKEWSPTLFSSWAYHYLYILSGNNEATNKCNSLLEEYIESEILFTLDGDSFTDERPDEYESYSSYDLYLFYDKILKSLDEWKLIRSNLKKDRRNYSDNYILLFNESTNEYDLRESDFFKDNKEIDKNITYLNKISFIKLIKSLIEEGKLNKESFHVEYFIEDYL